MFKKKIKPSFKKYCTIELIQELTWKKEWTIRTYFNRNKLSFENIEDIKHYLLKFM